MPSNVSIAYRGAHYAIGQGPQFYGIWHAAAPQAPPLEWWPLTPEGWTGAWSRFASIEAPGTIAPVTHRPQAHSGSATVPQATVPQATATQATATQPAAARSAAAPTAVAPSIAATPAVPEGLDPARSRRISRTAAAVLGVGVVLGIVSLFPPYVAGASLASQATNVVAHVIYFVAWSVSAILIALGGVRARVGALFGLGVSAVTFGFFVADLGTPIASGTHLMGAGLVLGVLGWLAATAGAGLAFRASPAARQSRAGAGPVLAPGRASRIGRLPGHDIVPIVTFVLAALGAAIAFAPSWDKFTLTTASGAAQVITAGNAFSNPAPVILGNVLVMVAIVAVVIAAVLWRSARLGAALAAGAIVPLVGQAISAIVQVNGGASPEQFGLTPAQANRIGLTIGTGLTPMFWVYCAFVATMILLCAWMVLAHEQPASHQVAWPYSMAPAGSEGTAAGAAPATGTPVVPDAALATDAVAPDAAVDADADPDMGSGADPATGAETAGSAADYSDAARFQPGSQ